MTNKHIPIILTEKKYKLYRIFFNVGKYILLIGFLIYLITNFYYGWNLIPLTNEEKIWDLRIECILGLGIITYLYPLLQIYEQMFQRKK